MPVKPMLTSSATIGWDLGRFGIQMVASPRHADGLLITGPVTRNMELALRKTYDAVPDPKIVIAVGACAISGGPFAGHAQTKNGAEADVPIDLFIPGCPPHPLTILDGLLRPCRTIETREQHEPRTHRRIEYAIRLINVCRIRTKSRYFSCGSSVLTTSIRSSSVPVANLDPSASPRTF